MKKLVLLILVTLVPLYAYSVCWKMVYQPQCAAPGDCFGSCTPDGCGIATCIQATGFGYEDWYNVRSGSPGKTTRLTTLNFNNCNINGCKLYNNCTHTYDTLPAWCHCSFNVQVYTLGPTDCP